MTATAPYQIDFSGPLAAVGGLNPLPLAQQLAGRIKGVKPFDPARIGLYRSDGQKLGQAMTVQGMRDAFARIEHYGAHALEFFLANLGLVPNVWKGTNVYFLTFYTDGRDLWLRGLTFYGSEGWGESRRCLSMPWPHDIPIAVPNMAC